VIHSPELFCLSWFLGALVVPSELPASSHALALFSGDPPVSREITDAELLAYLDEALAPEELARIEQELRGSSTLQSRAARLLSERDAGGDSIGEIWRRHRLSCPSRSELASGLAGDLPPDRADYVRFHVETIGCPVCRANLSDLGGARRDATADEAAQTDRRRKRIFESSVGRYPPRRD
jgi:hypothetical protein